MLEVGDRDDDSLPDSWEIQYGIDPVDRGNLDVVLQGEYGDFDQDGLMNREEYLLGTDPSKVDTDGDGLSDLAETRVHATDPNVSDVTPETLVATINPLSVQNLGTSWQETLDGGVVATNFRGSAEFAFTVPSDGHWLVQLTGQLQGDLRFDEEMPLIVSIDGKRVQRTSMVIRDNAPGSIRTLTPRLTAGGHQLSVFIDNPTARRSLEILDLKILEPGGLDTDSNGLPDWADQELTLRSHVLASHPLYSYTSPVLVEGHSPDVSLVDVSAIARSGQTNRQNRFTASQWSNILPGFGNRLANYAERLQRQMRRGHGRMEGYQIPHQAGPGTFKWFIECELNPNEAIGYVAQFEEFGIYEHRSLVWLPCNTMQVSSLDIAKDSELLLGAWVRDWDWQQVTLTITDNSGQLPADTLTFPSSQSRVKLFDTAGSFTITASHPEGQINTMTLEVHEASLPVDLVVGEGRFRNTQLPGMGTVLTLDTDEEIFADSWTSLSPAGSKVRQAGKIPGLYQYGARLGGLSENNAILTQQTAHVVGVSDALRHLQDVSIPQGDDIFLTRSPLLVTHLPDGATIEITIFAGGVTFVDGTTEKTFSKSDLDEFGVMTLEFLIPLERLGAPCHYIDIYDQHGVKVWNSTN